MKLFIFSILAAMVAAPAFAQSQPAVNKLAESELPSLLAMYKDLHTHPELSTHEERSSALVAKELRAVGCDVTENFGTYDKPNLKGYGVIGIMKNGSGRTVMVRTAHSAVATHYGRSAGRSLPVFLLS